MEVPVNIDATGSKHDHGKFSLQIHLRRKKSSTDVGVSTELESIKKELTSMADVSALKILDNAPAYKT